MNIYQGLLFLHGFRVLPDETTSGGAAADVRSAAAAQPSDAAVPVPPGAGAALPAAGA
ncbi:MAG: hypothetical protein M3Q11_07740 [Pseudomonadota bacterium]|nr:hypothetical protein [Pseudomonadota bacterium]